MSNPVPGTVIPSGSLISPGGSQGVQGVQGTAGPPTPSANTGNLLTTGTDNLLYLPPSAIQPTIWSARLRSWNSIGNPGFESDQRNCDNSVTFNGSGGWTVDRWSWTTSIAAGSGYFAIGQTGSGNPAVPGTSSIISQNALIINLQAQKTTLAAGDSAFLSQTIEGPLLRELLGGVHSVSIFAYTTIAGGLSFALSLRDAANTHSLTELCTIPGSTWTLVQLPNLPIWPSAATWSQASGTAGYMLGICLACGSTYMSPANGSWQNGNFIGAPGMSNMAAAPVGSILYLTFIQHEPGPLCTTLIDKPWTQNYEECQRYFSKSYEYGNLAGSVTPAGRCGATCNFAPPWFIFSENFPKTMAKQPTVTLYSDTTGASNVVRNQTTAADAAVSGFSNSSKRIEQFQAAGAAIGHVITYQYVADTGW